MTDLYLIAHKVRGEPAFDIAHQMHCPLCDEFQDGSPLGCHECDGLGYWWIIPTSGHRAYPAETWALKDIGLLHDDDPADRGSILDYPMSIMDGLPDHYPTREAPPISLVDALGLRKPKADPTSTPIARRF